MQTYENLVEMEKRAEEYDKKAQSWLQKRSDDVDLLDMMMSGIDGCLDWSLDKMRDVELNQHFEEDDDWN